MSHGRGESQLGQDEKGRRMRKEMGNSRREKGAWECVRDITPLLRSVGLRWTAGLGDVLFPILAAMEGSP